MRVQTVDLPPLSLRAAIGTINEEERTVEVVFSTGAPVTRSDWFTGKKWIEKLSLDPAHIRVGRLNNGAPLLDGHSGFSVREDQVGVVEPDSVRILKQEARATVRFSKRESVTDLFNDVRDRIVRNVSVGYVVHRYVEEEQADNKIPIRTAVDWEPYEISMVPMPADNAAKVRNQDTSVTHPCVIETRGAATMEREQSEYIAEPRLTLAPAEPAPAEPNERDAGVKAERERVQGIWTAIRAARLPGPMADKLIADGVPLLEAQARVFTELSRRDNATAGPQPGSGPSVSLGDDPMVHKRAAVENALLHRMAPEFFTLTDEAKQYRGLTLTETARMYMRAAGRSEIASLGSSQLWDAILAQRAGLHTTSDFANLLSDLPNKILQKAYAEAPQTFEPLVRRTTVSDFKPNRLLEIGEAPALLEVLEHGEIKHGTVGEGKETFQLASYARQFGITRKSLINDDTDAFSRLPIMMGRQVRKLESDLVWKQITDNAAMGDTVALFNAAHGNLAGSGGAIDVTTVGAANAAMKLQKGLDGATFIDVQPKYLIVPVAKEVIARQFVSEKLMATAQSAINPFAGVLTVIAEPRLDANSATAWYLSATPDQIGIIVVATLEGDSGPRVESKVGFDIQGVQTKVEYDFAAKVENYRGLYKNPGA